MVQRQLSQHLLTLRGQRQQYFSSILSWPAFHIATSRQPIHQLHRTVVLDLQALSQFSDSRTRIFRKAFQRQQ